VRNATRAIEEAERFSSLRFAEGVAEMFGVSRSDDRCRGVEMPSCARAARGDASSRPSALLGGGESVSVELEEIVGGGQEPPFRSDG
jgi:hypothetical protein